MRILILVATPSELKHFNLESKNVKVIFTGVGKLNAFRATRDALRKEHFDKIINIGTCGSDKYPIGTLLKPSLVKQGDAFTLHGFPSYSFEVTGDPDVSILTGDNFINKQPDAEGNLVLPEPMRAFDAYDMEAYAIALACAAMLQNLHFLKIVSDNLNGTLEEWEESAGNLEEKLVAETEKFIRENFISNYKVL